MNSSFGGGQMGYGQRPQPMGNFGQPMGYPPMGQPPMSGGYGMGGANPGMGGMGGFNGNQGPQMGGFGGGYGQSPQMGGFGRPPQMGGFNQSPQMGGFGGGYNPMGDMGQMNRGFNQQQMGGFGGGFGGGMSNYANSFPDPRMQQNQGQFMNPMQGFQQMQQRFGQSNGMGGMQGGQDLQGQMNSMSSLLRGMPMGNAQQGGMGLANGMVGLGQSPGMSGTASPQMNAQFQAFMNQSAGRPDNYGQSVGQSSMSPQTFGALSNPGQMGGMNQIPAYARSYAQNQMGSLPTQSQMMGTQAPQGGSMTADEFTSMMQSKYGRSVQL
jgi:hypothetical protein